MKDQVDDELYDMLASTVESLGLELLDIERRAASLRVVVDRSGGADLDVIADATRAVSAALDGHDLFPGRYTLEVSSPGVERRLRRPRDFTRAVGETVSVRTLSGGEGERRYQGRLASADGEGFVIDTGAGAEGDGPDGSVRRFAYSEIERARTVFEWGSPVSRGRPGSPARAKTGPGAKASRGAKARQGATARRGAAS